MSLNRESSSNIATDSRLKLDKGTKLYKYIDSKYCERTIKYGEVRIGTLFDYRRQEKRGDAIGDSQEGFSNIYDQVDEYDLSQPEKLPKITHEFFKIPKGVKNSYIRNIKLVLKRQSSNCYLLCFSKVLSRELLKEFNYDVVYSIKRPLEFLHEINVELRRLCLVRGRLLIMPCTYISREIHHSSDYAGISPALIKDSQYSKQEKVRTIWIPTSKDITPLTITVRGLGKNIQIEEKF
jgi:hypothetical protein